MKVMGIEFAPINTPMERRLQTLAAGTWFFIMMFGGPVWAIITIYILFWTNYWLITTIYLIWAYTLDLHTHEEGGRRIKFMRVLSWWKYMKNYFPIKVKKVSDFELDPKKNYLCCCYPHGVFSAGVFSTFGTDVSEFHELFPNHITYMLTLKEAFYFPFHREFLYALGGVSATARSIRWILGYPGGGKVAALVIGGAEEATYSRPGNYVIVLKNRKGFVKLALESGTSLIPVFSFREIDIFNQVDNPSGSKLRKFQQYVKSHLRINPVIPKGRGYFQYTFGIVPFRKPITTIVGEPLEVPKIEKPTIEDINDVHEKFMNKLTELFEKHKHEYLENADETNLIIK